MSKQKIEGRVMGRPSKRTEPYKRTTIELPISLLEFLKTVKPNRTEWLVEAAQEKREREKQE